jgi:AbrB family looped-hinge helix DNA binding protein
MEQIRVRMNENGRIVIPSNVRKALGIRPGDEVILELDEHEVHLTTLRQRIAKAQEMVRKHVPPGVSLVDELIAERQEEAKREFGGH